MKVLVLSQNRERAPFPVLPVGPALCCEALARAGHEARLLDLCFASRPDEVAAAVCAYRPDLVAIGVRNLDTADSVRPVTMEGTMKALSLSRPLARVTDPGYPPPGRAGRSAWAIAALNPPNISI